MFIWYVFGSTWLSHNFRIISITFRHRFFDKMLHFLKCISVENGVLEPKSPNYGLPYFVNPFCIKNNTLEETWLLIALGGCFAQLCCIVIEVLIISDVIFGTVCWFAVSAVCKTPSIRSGLPISLPFSCAAPRSANAVSRFGLKGKTGKPDAAAVAFLAYNHSAAPSRVAGVIRLGGISWKSSEI